MPQIRNYELITDIESSSPPNISPVSVGDAIASTDALSLSGMAALGIGSPATLYPVANLAALKAISADTLALVGNGATILREDTGQFYQYVVPSTLTSNDHNVITPTNATGNRFIQINLPDYVDSSSASRAVFDQDGLIIVDATAGSKTYTLPTAVGRVGKIFSFKKIDSSTNSVIIDPNGAETVNGASTFSFNRQYRTIAIMSDGTGWNIISDYSPLLEDSDYSVRRAGQTLLDLDNTSTAQTDILFRTGGTLRGTITVDAASGRLSFLSGTTTGTKQALLSLSDGTNTTTLGNENNVTPDYRLRWAGDTYLNSDRSTYTVGRVNGVEDLSLWAGASKQISFSSGGNPSGYIDLNNVWTIGRNQTSTSLSAHVIRNYSTASIAPILQVIGLGTGGNIYSGTATKYSILGYGASAWRLRMGSYNDTVVTMDDPETTVTFGSGNTALHTQIYAHTGKTITFYSNGVLAGTISSGNTWTIGNTTASSNNIIQSNVSTPLFLNTATGAAYCGLQFSINSVAKGTIHAPTSGGFCFFGSSTSNENAEMANDGTFSLGSDSTGNVTSTGTHQIFSTSTNVLDLVNGSATGNILLRARYNDGSGGTISDLGRVSFVKGTGDSSRYADFRVADTTNGTLRQVFAQYADGSGFFQGFDGSSVQSQASWTNNANFTFGRSTSTAHGFKTGGTDHTYLTLDQVSGLANTKEVGIGVSNTGGSGGGGALISVRRFDTLGAGKTAGYFGCTSSAATWYYIWVYTDGNWYTSATGGNVGSNTGTIIGNQPSDERLKENISKNVRGLDDLLKIETYSFDYKNNKEQRKIGFIAQQVKDIVPESVRSTGDREIDGKIEKDVLEMQYVSLIPVCVKAIQEQNEIISNLIDRIQTLEGKK